MRNCPLQPMRADFVKHRSNSRNMGSGLAITLRAIYTLPMSRPLRIEFPGAIYHVTSRGDRREPIYRDDEDRVAQIEVIARAMERFDAQALAYCQMDNHFHLVLHTRRANLSRLMRHVNGVYTQAFNRRHGLAGHLFQGRFKAIVVDRDAYLLDLCRHVERNPVATGLVARAEEWPWSSCRAHVGLAATPPWLDTDGLHGYLLGAGVQLTTGDAAGRQASQHSQGRAGRSSRNATAPRRHRYHRPRWTSVPAIAPRRCCSVPTSRTRPGGPPRSTRSITCGAAPRRLRP